MRPSSLVLLLAAGVLGAQQAPPGTKPLAPIPTGSRYGSPEPVPLSDILAHPERYERRMVRTQGFAQPGVGDEDFRLREGRSGEDLLLLPAVVGSNVPSLLGRPVEVTGVVRLLRPVGGAKLDGIEDPELPPLPAPDSRLPRASLSFVSITDATPFERVGEEEHGRFTLNAASRGRSLRVVGQFRGANLFNDLPDLPGRDANAFVLKDGNDSVWVIGKAPAGKGFSLDTHLKGDTRFWLEVEGRLEACGEQTCLRARHIAMAARPASGED